jgi:hypothetical protein
MMKVKRSGWKKWGMAALCLLAPVWISAQEAAPPDEAVPQLLLKMMPVKEVSVFKDGHAFVSHEGTMPVDARGNVQLDHLPRPVLGTFWATGMDKNARLESVVSGQRRVLVERTAIEVGQLLQANIGQRVRVLEKEENATPFVGVIERMLKREASEVERTRAPGAGPALPELSNLFLLKTEDGWRTLDASNVRSLVFPDNPGKNYSTEEFRNMMTMKLAWTGEPRESARVAISYLERGLRWIPSYRLNIREDGKVEYELLASLVNELVDLEDATVNLVVGVPSFRFKDMADPISLQETVAQVLSAPAGGSRRMDMYNNWSNAVMTQAAQWSPPGAAMPGSPGMNLGPDMPEGVGVREDLYVYTLKNVTLRKGERMQLSVAKGELPYTDTYVLKMPIAPPPETRQNFNNDQQRQIAAMLARPKVMHNIRLENKSEHPITTAPALVLRNGRILAQSMTTYAAPGAKVDVEITAAVNIHLQRVEEESGRESVAPNMVPGDSENRYSKVNLKGVLTLTNFSGKEVEVEAHRYVIGHPTKSEPEAKMAKISLFDFESLWGQGAELEAPWWAWYSWPWWWHHVNGVANFTWSVKLPKDGKAELVYEWHYFWRL